MNAMKTVRVIRRFFRLPADEMKLFLEAVFLLYYSKVLFLLFPFRFCIGILKPAARMDVTPDPEVARKIRLAVTRANRLAFWKNICLVKSFAARLMLQRRKIGSVLYLGLQLKGGKELVAHAWLMVGDFVVTPKLSSRYKEIFSI